MFRSISCCSDSDLCNKHLVPIYVPTPEDIKGAGGALDPSVYHVALLVSLTIFFFLGVRTIINTM